MLRGDILDDFDDVTVLGGDVLAKELVFGDEGFGETSFLGEFEDPSLHFFLHDTVRSLKVVEHLSEFRVGGRDDLFLVVILILAFADPFRIEVSDELFLPTNSCDLLHIFCHVQQRFIIPFDISHEIVELLFDAAIVIREISNFILCNILIRLLFAVCVGVEIEHVWTARLGVHSCLILVSSV